MLEQIRFSGLKPIGATYGLAMEVIQHNFLDFAHKIQLSHLTK